MGTICNIFVTGCWSDNSCSCTHATAQIDQLARNFEGEDQVEQGYGPPTVASNGDIRKVEQFAERLSVRALVVELSCRICYELVAGMCSYIRPACFFRPTVDLGSFSTNAGAPGLSHILLPVWKVSHRSKR